MRAKATARKFLADDVQDALEITRAEGNFLFDSKGRKYIDFVAGWCVGNLGWSREEIAKAIREFDGPAYIYPSHFHKSWAELAELLAEFAPAGLKKSFRATGGTEAVDIALQVAMVHTGR